MPHVVRLANTYTATLSPELRRIPHVPAGDKVTIREHDAHKPEHTVEIIHKGRRVTIADRFLLDMDERDKKAMRQDREKVRKAALSRSEPESDSLPTTLQKVVT